MALTPARADELTWCGAVLMLCLCGVNTSVAAERDADPFEACQQRFAATPEGYETAVCFYVAGARTGGWDEALQRLAALHRTHPENAWLTLSMAHVEWQLNDLEGARSRYQTSAERFQRSGEALGELMARQNLRNLLYHSGAVAAAETEVRRVVAIGRDSDDPAVVVRARVTEANHYMNTGQHIGRAYRSLRAAEHVLGTDAEYALASQVVGGLGNASLLLGEFDESVRHFERLVELATAAGDQVSEALARFNAANARLEGLTEMPDGAGLDDVVVSAEEALSAAVAAESSHVQIYAHRLLGELHALRQPETAAHHLDRCAELAEAINYVSECELYRARVVAEQDPARAEQLVESVLSGIGALGDDPRLAHGWHHLMRIAWQRGPPERAFEIGFRALDVIEALRRLQGDSAGRTGFLSAWTRDYYWLSGRLLEQGEVESAFTVLERMRARDLRERLSVHGDRGFATVDPQVATQHRDVLAGIVDLHRKLFRSGAEERQELLRELERLEIDERSLRLEGGAQVVGSTEPVALAALRESLDGDEALLSFQLGNWQDPHGSFAGGSWLVVVTRQHTHVERLPGRVDLARSVPLFVDLAKRGEVLPATAAALYQRLFADALSGLPESVNRLIIVPDGVLHQVPFAVLRSSLEASPVGTRYQIDLAPSASLWHDWRHRPHSTDDPRALILAAPELVQTRASPIEQSVRGDWLSDVASGLGTLPFARVEGMEVNRALGGAGRVLEGDQATESFLKSTDLASFDLIHFASHTVIDQRHPDRSAILLAPGSTTEDGLLQVREISQLRLDGTLVVLSSCQSATGTITRGEGVMGLARAFFEAGARTVIGSLWPVRDDHASDFFSRFYAHLGRGLSAGEALTNAQTEARTDGMPVDAWAGMVLIGDGSVTVTDSTRTTGIGAVVPGLAIALALALVLLWLWRHMAGRRP